jgi:hypothetical protein
MNSGRVSESSNSQLAMDALIQLISRFRSAILSRETGVRRSLEMIICGKVNRKKETTPGEDKLRLELSNGHGFLV